MSDYRRFIAYLYEYPNNRKGGCCGFVRVESQNGFCRMDFQIKSPSLPPETSVTVYGFIRRSGRMYGIPLGNLLAGRSSTSGKLFTHSNSIGQTDVTLDELGGLILLCRQTGVIATQWDDLPIQPEFFAPTLPQEPKTSADNGARPTEEKTAETPEPLDPAVPAQSLPSSDASKAQFDELSTEFSSNSELYPQNSNPESTVSTESTSTNTVNTVPADRITQSSANTLRGICENRRKLSLCQPGTAAAHPGFCRPAATYDFRRFSRRSSRAAVPRCSLSPASGPVPGVPPVPR
mgnify:CR=1 FL=1